MDSKSLFAFLSGYKTYIVGCGAIVYAVGIHFSWWPHYPDVDLAFGGAGAITIRAAISKFCAAVAADPRLKIAIAFLGLLLIGPNATFAGDAASPVTDFSKNPIVHDVQDVIEGAAKARAIELVIYPTYAPKLANQWGAGAAALYPVNDWAFVGLRGDLLDGQYFAASAGVGLKKTFNVFGFNVTPFALTGIVAPLNKAGDKTNTVGAIVGTGASVDLWQDKSGHMKASAFGEAEYWSQYPGIQIFHLGAQLAIGW